MTKKVLFGVALAGALSGLMLSANANNVYAEEWTGFGYRNGGETGYGVESKANWLGISIDELKDKLSNMTFLDIVKEKGLSMDDFHAKREEEVRARWEERGISEDEINNRLEQLKNRWESCDGTQHYQGSPFGQGRGRAK